MSDCAPPPLEDCARLFAHNVARNRTNQLATYSAPISGLKASPSSESRSPNSSNTTSDTCPVVKRGFFNNSKASPAQSTPSRLPAASIPKVIEVAPRSRPDESLRFPEVQHAMRPPGVFRKDDHSWVTGDLMRRIAGDPSLVEALGNPRFQEALNLMQKNPAEAKTKYSGDTEINDLFKRYMRILGCHFEDLAEKAGQTDQSGVVEMDGKTQALLQDPAVCQVLELLQKGVRIDPRQLPSPIFEKIKFLIDKKLIQIQS